MFDKNILYMKEQKLNHVITVHVSKEELERIKIEKDLFPKKWYQNQLLLFICRMSCWFASFFIIIYILKFVDSNITKDYWFSDFIFGLAIVIAIVGIIYLWVFYKVLFDNIYYLQRNKYIKKNKLK